MEEILITICTAFVTPFVAAAIVAAKVDEGERVDLDMFLDDVRDADAAIAERGRERAEWDEIKSRERDGRNGGLACVG